MHNNIMPLEENQKNNPVNEQKASRLKVLAIHPHDLMCSDSVLRKRSQEVTEIKSPQTASLCNTLCDIFYSIPYAKGLSAIQLGIPLQIALVNLSRKPGQETFFINPFDIKLSGRLVKRSEGCLCLPNYKASISRRNKITLNAFSPEGRKFAYSAIGYEAAVIQHELDHMSGRFYWDYLSDGAKPDPVS